jgi:quinol monooxygenase YgiN
MPDVVVIARARAVRGMEGELEEALREVANPTRAQAGCVDFTLYRSQQDPAVFVGVERWKAKADHDRHLQGPHFHKLALALRDIVTGPPETVWYDIVDDA